MNYLLPSILYAILFWAVTWRRPWLALLSIFALSPFQNDLSAGGPFRFSIAEVNLLLTLPVLIVERRAVNLGRLSFPIFAYLLLCLFASSLHWRSTTPISLIQISVYLIAAVAVFHSLPGQSADYRPALSALVAVCCLLAGCVIFKQTGYILGLHKNGAGASLACGLIVCTELWFIERSSIRKTFLLGALLLIAAGLFHTLSRGAWLTAAAGIAVLLAFRGRFILLLQVGSVFAILTIVCWGRLPAEARDYAAGFDRNHRNIQARYESLEYALAEFQRHPFAGAGVGLRKEYDATNVFALTLAETGFPGLAAFAAIHLIFLHIAWRSRRYLPRSSPEASLVALGAALLIGKALHGAVDLYWGRGDIMITWAAVGMAVRACTAGRSKYRRGKVKPTVPSLTPSFAP